MIAELGAGMAVAYALGVVAIAHVLLSSYRASAAVGGIVIGGVVAVVATYGLQLGSIAVFGMGDAASTPIMLAPIVGVVAGWIVGLRVA